MSLSKAFTIVNMEAELPLHIGGNETARLSAKGNPTAISQPAWFIDPINGDDDNTGDTPATALKTHEEFRDRIGSQIIGGPNTPSHVTVPINMVVTLLNDFPLDNPVYIDFEIGNQGTLTYKNGKTLTTLFTSGAGTIYTNTSENTNVQQLVSDPTSPVSWAAGGLINAPLGAAIRIRLTSGTASGAVAWTAKDAGANTARTSSFTTIITSVPTASAPSPALSPANGDTFVVEDGFVSIADFRVSSRGNSFGSSSGASTRLFFLELKLPQGQGQKPLVSFIQSQNAPNGFPEIFFSSCDVGTIEPRRATFVALSNCKHSGFASVIADGRLSVASGLCTQTINFQGASGQSQLFFNWVNQGGNLFVNTSNIICDRVGIFDSTGDAILILPGACYRAESIFGIGERTYGSGTVVQPPGVTNFGIRMRAFGNFTYQNNKPTITGVSGDVVIGGSARSYAFVPFTKIMYDTLQVGFKGAAVPGAQFVLPDYTQSVTDILGYVIPRAGLLQNLRVLSATAAGAGDVYTVFVNLVATAITATLTGTSAVEAVPQPVQVLGGQRVSFQAVNNAGSTASNVLVEVEFSSNDSNEAGIMVRN